MICKCGTEIKDNTSAYYTCPNCNCKWEYVGYWQLANKETREAIEEANQMKEEIKYGGGHYTCIECKKIVFGSALHECKKISYKKR